MPRSQPSQPIRRESSAGTLAIPVALGASIALHAGLGIAIGLRTGGPDRPTADRLAFTDFTVPEEAAAQRFVALGNPESRTASLSWIGHEEFEEMWAPKSEVDQALQDPEEPGEPVETPQPVEASDPQAQAERISEVLTASEQAQTEEQIVSAEDAPEVVSPPVETPEDYSDLIELVDAIEGLAADIPRFNPIEALRERRAAIANRREGERAAAPETQEAKNPPDSGAELAEKAEIAEPADSGQSGEQAEREADAAAVNSVRNDDLGKPLAAQGLSIRTVRPSFSNVTLATARPRNPIAQIDFRRNGKPIRVSIIRSSGHEQVDIEIRKALYSWRASGEALLQLPEAEDPESPAFVSIKLEILL